MKVVVGEHYTGNMPSHGEAVGVDRIILVGFALKIVQRILTFFSTKNNSVFVTLADICLTNLCLTDIVKLTML